jgi:hypothetical protein
MAGRGGRSLTRAAGGWIAQGKSSAVSMFMQRSFSADGRLLCLWKLLKHRERLLLDERLLVSAPQGQPESFHGSLNLVTHVRAKSQPDLVFTCA